jgi:aromatic ring-cleaving dioxygenase
MQFSIRIYWLAFACFLQAHVALAAPHTLCDKSDASLRCLSGHLFVPSRVYDSPFLNTSMGTRVEGRLGSTIDNRVKPPEKHALASAMVAYDLQVALLDWLAVQGGFSAAATSGGTNIDFIKFGLSGALDYQLGAKFRFWQSDRFILSGSARLVGSLANALAPIGIAEHAPALFDEYQTCLFGDTNTARKRKEKSEACNKIVKSLLKYQNQLGARINVGMGIGINQTMGVLIDAAYTHDFRDPVNALNFASIVQAGVTLSVDLLPTTEVPIAFLLGSQFAYRFDYETKFDHDIASLLVSAGAFYSGSKNFSAGVEFAYDLSPIFAVQDVTRAGLFSGSVNARYFWN